MWLLSVSFVLVWRTVIQHSFAIVSILAEFPSEAALPSAKGIDAISTIIADDRMPSSTYTTRTMRQPATVNNVQYYTSHRFHRRE